MEFIVEPSIPDSRGYRWKPTTSSQRVLRLKDRNRIFVGRLPQECVLESLNFHVELYYASTASNCQLGQLEMLDFRLYPGI